MDTLNDATAVSIAAPAFVQMRDGDRWRCGGRRRRGAGGVLRAAFRRLGRRTARCRHGRRCPRRSHRRSRSPAPWSESDPTPTQSRSAVDRVPDQVPATGHGRQRHARRPSAPVTWSSGRPTDAARASGGDSVSIDRPTRPSTRDVPVDGKGGRCRREAATSIVEFEPFDVRGRTAGHARAGRHDGAGHRATSVSTSPPRWRRGPAGCGDRESVRSR